MSRLDEYIQQARERGLDPCQIEWRLRLISATASLFEISPERIANDALITEEQAKRQRELRRARANE